VGTRTAVAAVRVSDSATAFVPPPVSSAGTGQIYSTAYLSPNTESGSYELPFEGYGSYDPEPYGQQPQPTPDGYGPSWDQGYSADPYYESPGAGYADYQPPQPDVGGSGRFRLGRLPRNGVLAVLCVVLLLASFTLLAMYIGQSGENGKTSRDLRKSQAAVQQRDTKIKQMDSSLTDAEAKVGSGNDQLTTAQNNLQKANADLSKARQDLTTANQDKQNLTSCLKALTAASAEQDPVKQNQLAQQSQQTCAPAFQLAGIRTN